MKEFLYQIFSNHFSNPIQKDKIKTVFTNQIQRNCQKDKIKTIFILVFILYSHLLFHFFSSGYENIYEKSPFLPPEGGVLPLLWRGVWFEVFKKFPILFSYPPQKSFYTFLHFSTSELYELSSQGGQSYRSSFFTTFIICSMFVKIPVSSQRLFILF